MLKTNSKEETEEQVRAKMKQEKTKHNKTEPF